jgi:hypothetical protein
MHKSKLHYASPEIQEEKRIAEIKSLSYLERLERLMAILEISYMLTSAKKKQINNEPTDH